MFNNLEDGIRTLSLRQLRDPDPADINTSIAMDNPSSFGGSKAGSISMRSYKFGGSRKTSNDYATPTKYGASPSHYGSSPTRFSPPTFTGPSQYDVGAPSFTETNVTGGRAESVVPEMPRRAYTTTNIRRSRRFDDGEYPY